MKYDSVLFALVLSVLLLFASTSFAADKVFLKIDGVDGESMDAAHNREIEVLAWSVGASVPFASDVAGGRGPGEPVVQDLSISKWIDTATPPLLMAMLGGQHFSDATLTVSAVVDGRSVDYFTIEMTDVVITSMATGGAAGQGRVNENITLTFAQFCVTYTLIAEDGSAKGQSEVCYDIAAGI